MSILVGGQCPVALKRAARLVDSWRGVTRTPETAAGIVGQLRFLRTSDELFDRTLATAAIPTLDEVRLFRNAGVARLTFLGRVLSGGEREGRGDARGPRALR